MQYIKLHLIVYKTITQFSTNLQNIFLKWILTSANSNTFHLPEKFSQLGSFPDKSNATNGDNSRLYVRTRCV